MTIPRPPKTHPYLLIADQPRPYAQTPAGLRRKSKESGPLWKPIRRRAQADLGAPALFPDDVDGWLFDIVDRAKDRILRSALVFLVSQDKRFLATVKEQVWDIIDRWPWVERYHREVVGLNADLRTGVIMQVLGLVYDWLQPHLSLRERTRIVDAIRRGMAMLAEDRKQDAFYLSAYGSNWLAVMLGGFGTAALATYHEIPESPEIVGLSIERTEKMLKRIGEDGGWEEGVFYWAGLVNLGAFFHVVASATRGGLNFLKEDRLRRTCYFPLYFSMAPKGRADFGDAHFAFDSSGAPLFALMASVCQDPVLQWAFWEYRQNR